MLHTAAIKMASASVQHGQADLLQHGDGEGIDEPAVASDGAPNIALEQRQPKKASRATEPASDPAQNGDAHASEDGLSSERGEQGPASPWHRQQISSHRAVAPHWCSELPPQWLGRGASWFGYFTCLQDAQIRCFSGCWLSIEVLTTNLPDLSALHLRILFLLPRRAHAVLGPLLEAAHHSIALPKMDVAQHMSLQYICIDMLDSSPGMLPCRGICIAGATTKSCSSALAGHCAQACAHCTPGGCHTAAPWAPSVTLQAGCWTPGIYVPALNPAPAQLLLSPSRMITNSPTQVAQLWQQALLRKAQGRQHLHAPACGCSCSCRRR